MLKIFLHIYNTPFIFEKNGNDPNIALENLIKALQDSYNEVFPLRKLSKRKMKKKRKPWMNYQILSMIKKKHQLFKKYLNNRTPENLGLFKTQRNKIKREVEKAKKHYYFSFFKNCKNDSKKIWKGINALSNRNAKVKSSLPKFIKKDKDGNLSTDPKFIINKLNKHFVCKGPKLADSLPKPKKHSLSYLKKKVIKSSMCFNTITEDVLIKLM